MTAAIYARVSTEDQSVIQQLTRLRAETTGATEYVDNAVSGRLASRPAFDKMREDARSGKVTAVYAVKLDRLGRSASNILEFFREMEDAGVRVVVVDQQIDTATPVGRMVRTILAGMAELEADLIRERTREAMRAFKDGSRIPKGRVGRPPRLTPELLTEIRRVRDSGAKWSKVALTLHVPAASARKWYSRAKRAGGGLPGESSPAINGGR